MRPRKATLQYVLLLVLLVWSAGVSVTVAVFEIYQRAATKDTERPFAFHGRTLDLAFVNESGRAAGLHRGDEIVTVNGERITGYEQLDRLRMQWRPGEIVRIGVLRKEKGQPPKAMDMALAVSRVSRPAIDWTTAISLFAVLPLISLAIGFFVAFTRPRDLLAWLTMALLASFGQIAQDSFFALSSPIREIVMVYRAFFNATWPLWVMLFGLYFPEPFDFLRRRRWIPWLLSIPFVCLLALSVYIEFYVGHNIARIRPLVESTLWIERPATVFAILCAFSFFASIAIKLAQERHPDARRRLQWLLTGCGVGLTPVLVLALCQSVLNVRLPLWFIVSALLLIVLFPLTLGYVIVVQRAMNVRVALRIGVQYTLARRGITVVRICLAGLIIFFMYRLARSAGNAISADIVIGVCIALLFLLRKAGQSVIGWTDRRFFREAYDTEVILTELSQNVAGIRDMKTLLETVSRQISDSLHVPRVAVLLDSSESFRPAYSLGYNPVPSIELKPEGTAVQVLKETRQPSRVYLDDENSWTQRTPEEEREILRILDSQLLLPLALKDRLLGIISLGPKLSEEPYSADDLRLLHAVASQTGLALENARLTESIKVEVARRERINRELEIAREVQQRLFPQHLPAVEGLDLAAYCRPQQGVGGDYYDFLRLEDGGCIGIAIGDVSGKGISAALTMATLQASLRGRTISQSESLAEMIGLINRLVYDASASNRYATFFYAQYYPKTRLLRYVNAGHNAPILCRFTGVRPTNADEEVRLPAPNRDREGADALLDIFNENVHKILRLEEGGTVIGLFPDWIYNEGSVQLEPGDTLVAFTDGISEAMNEREEEWDEDRLIAAICESHNRTAADTIAHILDRVDAFTGGARQHDDMTLIVVRVQ